MSFFTGEGTIPLRDMGGFSHPEDSANT